MKRLMIFAAFAVIGCATLPAPGRPALPDIQFKMRDFRLANGMRIIVEEDHGSPLVGVFTCVGVGSSGDPAGKEGLAHLVEHLMFRNRADGKNTMWDRLESSGVGILNAFTNFDNTVYFEVGSKDILGKFLQVEGQRMTAPMAGIDPAVFDIEREVVRNELRQRGETQVGPAIEWLQEAVFPPGFSYARPIGGSHASLTAISFEDAKRFTQTYYQPSNMTMLVIGDVDLTTIQDVLAANLPKTMFVPVGGAAKVTPRIRTTDKPPPEPPPAKLTRHQATVATPELHVAWSMPPGFGDDAMVQNFVVNAAGGALQEAWLSDPDIVSIGVEVVPGVEASMLIASATLRKADHPEKSLEHILDQLVNLWAGEAGEASAQSMVAEDRAFGRMRNGAVVGMTIDAENIMSRGTQRVIATHFTGDPLMYGTMLKQLKDIGPGQVSHYSEQWLKRDRARAVLVEPLPATAKDSGQSRTGLGGVAAEQRSDTYSPDEVRALGKSRSAQGLETVVHGSKARSDETLPNGLRVVLQRRSGLPVAVVDLVFPVGEASAMPGGAGKLANLANPSGHRNGRGGDFGIQWQPRYGSDVTALVGSGANGNLPNMLAQLSDMVGGMRVDGSSLAEYKRDFLDYEESVEKLPQEQATRELMAALYKDHPLGRSVRAKELQAVTEAEITGWLDKVFSPKGAVLVVSGDIDVDKTSALVKTWLGGWQAPSQGVAKLAPATLRTDALPSIQVIHRPGATQAEMHIACLAQGGTMHQELAGGMVAELLGSSLFRSIRGQLGATYGVHGSARTRLTGNSELHWQGDLENGRLAAALKVLKKTWDGFEKDGLSEDEVGRARWQQAREATINNITSSSTASVIGRWVLLGRNPEEVDRVFDDIASVKTEELKTAWSQCRGNAVMSFVGDETTVKAALKEAGY